MKPAYKLTPTQRANRRKYEAYTNAQRAYFRITSHSPIPATKTPSADPPLLPCAKSLS